MVQEGLGMKETARKPLSVVRWGSYARIEHRCPKCLCNLYRREPSLTCPPCGQPLKKWWRGKP